MGSVSPPALFFLSKIVLAAQGLQHFPVSSRVSLSASAKKPAGILGGIVFVDQFGEYCRLTVLIVTHKHEMLFHLFRS